MNYSTTPEHQALWYKFWGSLRGVLTKEQWERREDTPKPTPNRAEDLPKVPPSSKICITCKKLYDISQFPINKRSADGHSGKCYECTKRYNNAYYANKRSPVTAKSQKGTKPPRAGRKPGVRPMYIDTETHKHCRSCGILLPRSEFTRDKSTYDGYCCHCRKCKKERRNLRRNG